MEDMDGVLSCRPESRGSTYAEVYSVTPEAAGALVAEYQHSIL